MRSLRRLFRLAGYSGDDSVSKFKCETEENPNARNSSNVIVVIGDFYRLLVPSRGCMKTQSAIAPIRCFPHI